MKPGAAPGQGAGSINVMDTNQLKMEVRPSEGGADAARFATHLTSVLARHARHTGWTVSSDNTGLVLAGAPG